jgi:hypothetical protein
MPDCDDPDKLPLPKGWPRCAKTAVLHAVSLASAAFVLHLERWLDVISPRARREVQGRSLDAALRYPLRL